MEHLPAAGLGVHDLDHTQEMSLELAGFMYRASELALEGARIFRIVLQDYILPVSVTTYSSKITRQVVGLKVLTENHHLGLVF